MKKGLHDVLLGVLIFFLILMCEFILSMPFDSPGGNEYSSEREMRMINIELLATAVPAGIVTFLFAARLKTQDDNEAFRRSSVWTAVTLVFYLAIGIGNGTFSGIFGQVGVYILLLCMFLGPILYVRIKQYRQRD